MRRPRHNFSGAADNDCPTCVGSDTKPLPTNGKPVHVTLGRLYKIEGHTRDGRKFEKTFTSKEPILVHDEKRKLDLVYDTRIDNAPRKNFASNLHSILDHAYTPLHEGAPAVAFYADRRRRPRGPRTFQCVIDTITYWKRTTESDEHLYRHVFELPDDQKLLCEVDGAGELWFQNQGSIVVTERGIEDKPMNKHQIMRANAYREVGASRMRAFRDNPFTKEAAMRVPMASAFVGLTVIGVLKGLDKLYADGPQAVKNMTGYKKAAAEALSGVALAIVGDAWLPEALLPIAAGVGIGGVVAGGLTAIDTYKAGAAVAAPAAIPAPAAAPAASSGVNGVHSGYYQPAYGGRR